MTWPVAGGQVRDVATERNLRDIRKRGGEVESRLGSYLQLAVSGTARKIALGESTIKFTESFESETKSISHGLGVKPVFVGYMLEAVTGTTVIGFRTTERTTTAFKVFANSTPNKVNATLTFTWLAIG